jgi:hypothetical protein
MLRAEMVAAVPAEGVSVYLEARSQDAGWHLMHQPKLDLMTLLMLADRAAWTAPPQNNPLFPDAGFPVTRSLPKLGAPSSGI